MHHRAHFDVLCVDQKQISTVHNPFLVTRVRQTLVRVVCVDPRLAPPELARTVVAMKKRSISSFESRHALAFRPPGISGYPVGLLYNTDLFALEFAIARNVFNHKVGQTLERDFLRDVGNHGLYKYS